MTTAATLPVTEAAHRISTDHDLLLRRIEGRSPEDLAAPYQVGSGPLGDFCESLHDLLAHVLMWDEISLAVLTAARAGRGHWSVEPRWETAEIGRALNRSGVLAGRELPAGLLLHRLRSARDALLLEIECHAEDAALAQQAMTVPGQPAFVHAAIHLDELDWLS